MKKFICTALSFLMCISLALTGCFASVNSEPVLKPAASEIKLTIGEPEMTVDGAKKPIDENGTRPVIVNGITLLPIRAAVNEMGGNVSWDAQTRTVTLVCGTDEIKLTIGSETAYLNGTEHTLDTPPQIINDRTMLPIRFIAESFGYGVSWDDTTKTVTLTKNTAADMPNQTPDTPDASDSGASDTQESAKSLVAYFSVTGNTKSLAEKIALLSGSDIFEIIPETPYTSDDINYSNDNCRANAEQHDDSARPQISQKLENFEDYDVIFLGYPIWWGTMPKIINTFIESYDFSGKTVIPFCTSGGSGISASVSALESSLPDAEIKTGLRGSSSSADSVITDWFTQNGFEKDNDTSEKYKILLSWDTGSAEMSLYDNQTAKDLYSRLPLEVSIEDYNGTEKIIRFDDKLEEDSTAKGLEPTAGDVAVYAPWGNIAVFYKPFGYSDDLIKLGKVENGLDALSEISDGTKVTVTKL